MNRLLVLLTFFGVASSLTLCRAEEVTFTRDIRPILSGRCFKCHGPDANAREADLRLDRRKDAIDGEVIVPGIPDESVLMARLTTTDPDERMPPGGMPLSSAEIEAFRVWIKAGARYDQHWAYVKPQPPGRIGPTMEISQDVPASSRAWSIRDADWWKNPRNPMEESRRDEVCSYY